MLFRKSYYSNINFKVKYTRAKDFLNEINCKQPLISNTVYGRRHSKIFINCHVSWDTLYNDSQFILSSLGHAYK